MLYFYNTQCRELLFSALRAFTNLTICSFSFVFYKFIFTLFSFKKLLNLW